MSCKDKDGGTHHYACACREEHYRTENIRMIRAIQSIQAVLRRECLCMEHVAEMNDICREAIAPREVK